MAQRETAIAEITPPTTGNGGVNLTAAAVKPAAAAPTKQRYVLILMEDMQNSMLDYSKVERVGELLEQLPPNPAGIELNVLVASPGGDAHSAYKMAKILRSHSSHVRFFVVEYAKSAATLLSLCGDEILMGTLAELGPLDMQMEHMNLEGRGSMSALEAVKPIDYFIGMADRIAQHMGHVLRERVGLSRSESFGLALEHAERLLAPVMEKIEPSAVSQASRQLDVTRVYATRLLKEYHFKGDPEGVAESVAQKLVWLYPDHGCVIWRDEAREIGLTVKDGEGDPLWPAILAAYRKLGGVKGTHLSLATMEAFQKDYEPTKN